MVNAETQRAIVAIINELPKQQAKCVEMYYFRCLSQAEIGEQMGLPRDTIKTHLDRARKKICEILQNLSPKQSISTVYGREENSIRHLAPRVYRESALGVGCQNAVFAPI
ncbi:MAG: RNA polymerase sigma factor [Ignavibacteriales bacterium]